MPSIAPDDPVSLNSTGADVPMRAFSTNLHQLDGHDQVGARVHGGRRGGIWFCQTNMGPRSRWLEYDPDANYAKLLMLPVLYTYFIPGIPPAPTNEMQLNQEFPGGGTRHLHGTPLLWHSNAHGPMHFVGRPFINRGIHVTCTGQHIHCRISAQPRRDNLCSYNLLRVQIQDYARTVTGLPVSLSQRLAGACLPPQSPSWAAIPSDWGAVPIRLTEGVTVFGSHPCWQ